MLTFCWLHTNQVPAGKFVRLIKPKIDGGWWNIMLRPCKKANTGGWFYCSHRLSRLVVVVPAANETELEAFFGLHLAAVLQRLKLPASLAHRYLETWQTPVRHVEGSMKEFLNRSRPGDTLLMKNAPSTASAEDLVSEAVNQTVHMREHYPLRNPLDFWIAFAAEQGVPVPEFRRFTFEISLPGLLYAVRRTLTVPDWLNFADFHLLLTKAMGWSGFHLYEFRSENLQIEMPDSPLDPIDLRPADPAINRFPANEIRLRDVFSSEHPSLNYLYDFGDDWLHEIKLISDQPACNMLEPPKLEKIKGPCPPEDCGGAPFYNQMVREFWTYGFVHYAPKFRMDKPNIQHFKAEVLESWRRILREMFPS